MLTKKRYRTKQKSLLGRFPMKIKDLGLSAARALFVPESLISVAIFCLPVSKGAAETCFILALISWIGHKILSKAPFLQTFRRPYLVLYAGFFLLTLFSLFQIPSALLSKGFVGILKWSKYLAIFIMCLDVFQQPEKQVRLVKVFLISMVIVALDGFYQLYSGKDLFFGYPLDPGRIVRMKGSFGAPNLLASFLLFAVPFSAFLFQQTRSRARIFWAGCFFLFLAAFFLTYSRGAFYALVISLGLHLISLKKTRVALFFVAGLALLMLVIPSFQYNFIQTLKKNDITIVEREKYWQVACSMIQKHPLAGVGVNAHYARFQEFTRDKALRQNYPHNCYLQMASEIGIPGFLIFTTALFCALGKRPRCDSDLPLGSALRIALLAFLIQGFFDNNLYALQPASLFWVFWGCWCGLIFPSEETSPLKSSGAA